MKSLAQTRPVYGNSYFPHFFIFLRPSLQPLPLLPSLFLVPFGSPLKRNVPEA